MNRSLLVLPLLCSSLIASVNAQNLPTEDKLETSANLGERQLPRGFFLEKVEYEEYVYSRSKKTELGDQVEIDASIRYQHDENTFGRFRFETDPVDNRFNNKTSKFELLGGHKRGNFLVQIDTELNSNDGGGTSIGFDLDSEGTFLGYKSDAGLGLTFFPFNFDGEVGVEFDTYDVTRIYYIDGSPSTVNNTQLGSEKIAEKTIPGLELSYEPTFLSGFKFYVGAGVATYLYPTNANYNIQTNRAADRWERRQDFGYKFGAKYKGARQAISLEAVGHDKSEETGSLLEAAASLNFYTFGLPWGFFSDLFVEGEITVTKAGKAPYRTSRTSTWFEQTSPFQPVYSDYYGNTQDWVGKTDSAYALKLGHKLSDTFLPYVFYRYQGKHFIFKERESAHTLRTADEAASHGGLNRLGVGLYKVYDKFTINPEFEWLKANNPVFGNSSDVRADRVLSSFKKNDFLLYLIVSYNFDGSKVIK